MISRRKLLISGALAFLAGKVSASQLDKTGRGWNKSYSGDLNQKPLTPGIPGRHYQPVITPNGSTLPWKIVDGIKIYHLVAEEVHHEFAPGLKGKCWGYNGQVHGPTIEAVEGDRIRIYVTNKLPAKTSVHWHGAYLPNGMDGVGGLSHAAIPHGETFKYEWTLRQHGTLMYHSHHDEMTQMALGLMGMMVIHPRTPSIGYKVDRDFAIMLSEWTIEAGTYRPNPNAMGGFNILTMNAKAFPGTEPLVAKVGDKVRIRFGNLSAMDHHPIHLHGHHWKVTATDGGQIPLEGQWPETTVLVPTGSTRDVEFIATEPGDWAMHCHMTHHVMNQMGHEFPNLVGVDPKKLNKQITKLVPNYMTMGQHGMGEMADMKMAQPENTIAMVGGEGPFGYITMGGMFTIVKVRKNLTNYKNVGWYQNPLGTIAKKANPRELKKDGIRIN